METTAAVKNCKVEGCKRVYRAKGFCNVHFKKWRRGELPQKPRYKTCGEENCRKPMFKAGQCEEHWKAASGVETKEAAPAMAAEAPPAEAPKAPAPAPENAKKE